METLRLLGTMLGLSLASGVRLYAAVLALGLGIRFDVLQLDPRLSHLEVLADTRILAVAAVACVIEFLADKIPWVDSFSDAFHTFVRPAGAIALAATALGRVDPVTEIVIILLCGGVALTGHSSKAATRLLVNHSPEPFTNISLSVLEDLFVPLVVWLAFRHPVLTLVLIVLFISVFAWVSPRVFRSLRVHVHAVAALLRRLLRPRARRLAEGPSPGGLEAELRKLLGRQGPVDRLPPRYAGYLERKHGAGSPSLCLRTVPTRSLKGLRNSIGYLCFCSDRGVFITRRCGRFRVREIELAQVTGVEIKRGLLLDRLVLNGGPRPLEFYLFKDAIAL